MVGHGVLLDVPAGQGRRWLEPGTPIGAAELNQAAGFAGVTVGTGDIVLVRTGAMAWCRDAGTWAGYCAGDAAGLGSIYWMAEREVAALADTWGLEVLPNETPDVFLPLHIVFIAHMGLWIGGIWDLEEFAADCEHDRVYEFLFCGPSLSFTRAVGSPLNPMAIK